jgi:hypothetical protein
MNQNDNPSARPPSIGLLEQTLELAQRMDCLAGRLDSILCRLSEDSTDSKDEEYPASVSGRLVRALNTMEHLERAVNKMDEFIGRDKAMTSQGAVSASDRVAAQHRQSPLSSLPGVSPRSLPGLRNK